MFYNCLCFPQYVINFPWFNNCDKQYESELANINFEIIKHKGKFQNENNFDLYIQLL